MKQKIAALLLSAFLIFSFASCAKGGAADSITPTSDIVLLYTNDVHCGVNEGMGYAGVAALKKEYEASGSHVLLIDAGDAVQGAPMGTISKGSYIVDIMNSAGYDFAVPGNHEFDYGMDTFKGLVQKAEYTYSSCNFTDLATKEAVLPPYEIIDFYGVKIALVGVTTPATITSSTPAYFQDSSGNFIYGFNQDDSGEALYTVVQTNVDKARAEGAGYVVLVGHLGISESTSPWMSTEVVANTTGIDAVIDGHSHSTEACIRMKNKNGDWVLISQTGSKLTNVGMLLISKNGNVSTGFVSSAQQDLQVKSLIENIEKQYEGELAKQIGTSETLLTINDPKTGVRLIRNAETNMGDFCADAYRNVTGADISIVNGGGIRTDMPKGIVTYGDVLNVHPFGNQLCVVEATGQEILDALEHGARVAPSESGAFLQVSGLSYTIDTSVASTVKQDENGMFTGVEGERRVKDVIVGTKPIDPAATYTLASHDYLLKNGGDGFTMFSDNKFVIEDFMLDNQALMTYVNEALGGVIPASYESPYGDGRITLK